MDRCGPGMKVRDGLDDLWSIIGKVSGDFEGREIVQTFFISFAFSVGALFTRLAAGCSLTAALHALILDVLDPL